MICFYCTIKIFAEKPTKFSARVRSIKETSHFETVYRLLKFKLYCKYFGRCSVRRLAEGGGLSSEHLKVKVIHPGRRKKAVS